MHAVCMIKLPYFYSNVREKWGAQKIREINMFDHFFFSAAVELLLLHFMIFFIFYFLNTRCLVSKKKREKNPSFCFLCIQRYSECMKTILKKKLKRPVEVIVYVLCITDIPLQK